MHHRYIFRKLIKILFLDKYIIRRFGKDLGIIKLKNNYIVDIPKSGSSTIKHFASLGSKRYEFCRKYLNIQPKHEYVIPVKKIRPINEDIKVFMFIRPPEERLYSLYKQKVSNFEDFPFGYSLIKKDKFYLTRNFKSTTQFYKENSFFEFCNGIKNLNKEFLEKGYNYNLFDKHILPQFKIILNLQETYNNTDELTFIIYPIKKINNVLSSFLGRKVKRKINSTKKDNINYLQDIKASKIIDLFYAEDKLLYDKLMKSQNGFLEFKFDAFNNLNN
tara:strand:+ start:246 stop:1070 length:825 start_codon:yes stop_codon:yes gene_type:complete